jgi:hypothetical protein
MFSQYLTEKNQHSQHEPSRKSLFVTSSLPGSKRGIIENMLSPTPINPGKVVVVDHLPVHYWELLDNSFCFRTRSTLQQTFGREELQLPEQDISDDNYCKDERQNCLLNEEPEVVSYPSLCRRVKKKRRFRALKSEQWFQKFKELVRYKEDHDDCLVPNNSSSHDSLAQWVKRQRYQHKLREEGKHSTLTDERKQALESIGFVWSTHGARWGDRFEELQLYLEQHGHCNVPKDYTLNRELAVWVKYQRRLYKMMMMLGEQPRALTPERIQKMNNIGLCWDRRLVKF